MSIRVYSSPEEYYLRHNLQDGIPVFYNTECVLWFSDKKEYSDFLKTLNYFKERMMCGADKFLF